MGLVMKKPELIDKLAEKTGFYKKNMKLVVEALYEIVEEQLKEATFEQDSELHIATGVVICGHRKPEQEAVDPRNRQPIITPEKVVPYAVFKPTIRLKLYKKPKGYTKKNKKV